MDETKKEEKREQEDNKKKTGWKTKLSLTLLISSMIFFGGNPPFEVQASHIETEVGLPYDPVCDYTDLPSGGWFESFDAATDTQKYCRYHDGFIGNITNLSAIEYIKNPLLTNGREWFNFGDAVLWKPLFLQEQGNVRNVWINFEYYFPSVEGFCMQTELRGSLEFSTAFVYVTNDGTDLSEIGTFDDAFYKFNDEIVCDEWRTFSHQVKEFTGDHGSAFSGQSKIVGNVGFELSTVYLRNLNITGTSDTVVMTW